jgi:hypothetical protein
MNKPVVIDACKTSVATATTMTNVAPLPPDGCPSVIVLYVSL